MRISARKRLGWIEDRPVVAGLLFAVLYLVMKLIFREIDPQTITWKKLVGYLLVSLLYGGLGAFSGWRGSFMRRNSERLAQREADGSEITSGR